MEKSSKNRPGGKQVNLSQRDRIRLRNSDPSMKEQPDPTPIHIPGLSDRDPPLSLRDEMRRFIRQTVNETAQKADEVESFEEANDFEIEDDLSDILSQYTVVELAPEGVPKDDLEGQPTQEDLEVPPTSSLDNQGASAPEGSEATGTASPASSDAPVPAQQ